MRSKRDDEFDILLRGVLSVGWLGWGHHQRLSTTVSEEVDRRGLSIAVGGLKSTSEVRSEVDGGVVDLALLEDTRDVLAGGCLGEVTDNDTVDEEVEERVLVSSVVLLQQGSGVLVTDGHVVGHGSSSSGRNGQRGRETHDAGEID